MCFTVQHNEKDNRSYRPDIRGYKKIIVNLVRYDRLLCNQNSLSNFIKVLEELNHMQSHTSHYFTYLVFIYNTEKPCYCQIVNYNDFCLTYIELSLMLRVFFNTTNKF